MCHNAANRGEERGGQGRGLPSVPSVSNWNKRFIAHSSSMLDCTSRERGMAMISIIYIYIYIYIYTRGIQKVHRPTQLTTRYAGRIL